jgi:hypothetical protein
VEMLPVQPSRRPVSAASAPKRIDFMIFPSSALSDLRSGPGGSR